MDHSLACILAFPLFATPAFALTTTIPTGNITLQLAAAANINIATDGTPQDLTFAPGDPSRIFIQTRSGDIRILSNGVLDSTPFLSTASAGISLYTGGEGGFLGMAFSPNYATDHTFYTLQTETFATTNPPADFSNPEDFPTTAINPNNQITLRQWTTSGDPNVANTTSTVLLRINHPESNHQGGSLRFGPDGDLYLGLGDGGGANDFNGSADSNVDGHNNAIGNGQDLTTVLGKILRINPDPTARPGFTTSANGKYSIPDNNPFIAGSNGALQEIYAYGLRNPYKINFDSLHGTLYAADVGQSQREEIDAITSGTNYGWPFREGTRDNSADAQRTLPPGFSSTDPIAEYTHADGIAIIGGVLYRGSDPSLNGQFVFGDLGATDIGRLFYTDPADGNIFEFQYDSSGLLPSANLYSVDAGPDGELYALFSNGQVLSLTVVPEPASLLLMAPVLVVLLQRCRPKGAWSAAPRSNHR